MEWSVNGRSGKIRGVSGYLMEADHIGHMYPDAQRKPVYIPTHVLSIALHSHLVEPTGCGRMPFQICKIHRSKTAHCLELCTRVSACAKHGAASVAVASTAPSCCKREQFCLLHELRVLCRVEKYRRSFASAPPRACLHKAVKMKARHMGPAWSKGADRAHSSRE